jgi:O-antigen ligase
MPPLVAALITFAATAYLLRRESRQNPGASGALWLPVAWFAIAGSRFLSQWLNLGGGSAGDLAEGSAIDAAYFLALIVLGLRVLAGRRFAPGRWLRANPWVAVFLLYGFAAILWSDFPFIALKRWIKALGNPVMALVILTDRNPGQAFRIVMKRCAYLMLPLSLLFIKYFPEYGRAYSPWTGEGYNQGITTQKNSLGFLAMSFGIFYAWDLWVWRRHGATARRRLDDLVSLGFLVLSLGLLYMAHSSTSLLGFAIGVAVVAGLGFPIIDQRYLGTWVVSAAVLAVLMEAMFDLYDLALDLLGEDRTLTDRTKIWADCLELTDDPVIGVGYESFWLGPRLEVLWEKWPFGPLQAHNGYLEIYLDLGGVGLVLLVAMLMAGFHAIKRELLRNPPLGRLKMAYFFVILAFNYAEASFKGVHPLLMLFYAIALAPVAVPGESWVRRAARKTPRRYPVSSRRADAR